MAKMIEFSKGRGFPRVTNEDGERDIRMNMKDVNVDEVESEKNTLLEKFEEKFRGKELDQVIKEFGIQHVHAGMILEMISRKAKGKKIVLSDGNIEMMNMVAKKVFK